MSSQPSEMEMQRIYTSDLPRYEQDGWKPCLHEDGSLKVQATPTGLQTWVVRAAGHEHSA